MKITFDGPTFQIILEQMESVLLANNSKVLKGKSNSSKGLPLDELLDEGPGPERPSPVDFPVDNPVYNPVDNPVDKPVGKSPAAADKMEKLRAAKAAKKAAKEKEAAAAPTAAPAPAPAPKPAPAPAPDPAEIVRIRAKTIEDLQTAYANGHQKEVFELLSRFGNGAKSFRELQADAFLPIREAIDNGALT